MAGQLLVDLGCMPQWPRPSLPRPGPGALRLAACQWVGAAPWPDPLAAVAEPPST